jgi:hypothetical protein
MENFNRISVALIVIVIIFWASKVGTHLGYARWDSKFNRYLAPGYFVYGKVKYKTNMYAFGVVLLELITRRNPIDT